MSDFDKWAASFGVKADEADECDCVDTEGPISVTIEPGNPPQGCYQQMATLNFLMHALYGRMCNQFEFVDVRAHSATIEHLGRMYKLQRINDQWQAIELGQTVERFPAIERLLNGQSRDDAGGTAEPAWIPWHGGECPVSDAAIVEVELRLGNKGKAFANSWYWQHTGLGGDIIAYRVVGGGE